MQVNARWLSVLVVTLAGWLSGCGQEDDSQFSSYGELSESDSVAKVASQNDSAEAVDPKGHADAPQAQVDSSLPKDGQTATDSTTVDPTAPEPPVTGQVEGAVGATGQATGQAAGADPAGPSQTTAAASPGESPPAESNAAEADTESAQREVRLLIPKKDFEVEGPDGALRVSYDDLDLLKVLNMDPVTIEAPGLLPDWMKALSGKKVRVRGFMYPTFEETGLTRFILARDNQICCFGREAKVYDLIQVGLASGVTTSYIQGRPFDVVGTFRIEPEVFGEDLDRLYVIEDAVLIDR